MASPGIGVGLVGLGTIGTGVVRVFREHADEIEARLGFPLRLAHIADVDLETDRGVSLEGYRLSRDFKALVEDEAVDLVVELVGGTTVAAQVVTSALGAGKGVVTANKALLAHKGAEIYALAETHGAPVAFEASVGGTIPVLRALREGLCADRLFALRGIVNGTCNYILSSMESDGEPYEACLKRAQELGYAEADPTFDVDGTDSAHKLAILLGLAFGVHARPGDFHSRGIQHIAPADIRAARRMGLRIKLLASARRLDAGVEARVEPTLIPAGSVLAGVDGSMNAIEVRGAMSGPTLYYGAGAGSLPTASAVVADLMELARARRLGVALRVPPLGTHQLEPAGLLPSDEERGEYFVRLELGEEDRPSRVSAALAEHGVPLASLDSPPGEDLTLTTGETSRDALDSALALIGSAASASHVIRIEKEI